MNTEITGNTWTAEQWKDFYNNSDMNWKYKILDNWNFRVQDLLEYYIEVKENYQHLKFSKDVMTKIEEKFGQRDMTTYHCWSAMTRYKDINLPCPLYRGDESPYEIVEGDTFDKPTELMFGIVKRIVDRVPGVFQIGLACHDPGFVIDEHTDITHDNIGDYKIHIPIITNENAYWYFGNEPINLKVGNAYFLNSVHPHGTKNLGNTIRVHLMMTIRNESIGDVITKKYDLT